MKKDVGGRCVLWSDQFIVRPQLRANHPFLTPDFRKRGQGYVYALPKGVTYAQCEPLLRALLSEAGDSGGGKKRCRRGTKRSAKHRSKRQRTQ